MEQRNSQRGDGDDDKSSSEEIDLELQDDETQVNQEGPSEQQVLSHLLEIGEYIDFLDPTTNKWITMKILDIQTQNIRLQSPATQNILWTQFQYESIRKQWIPGVPLLNTRVEVYNPNKGWVTGIVIQAERDSALIHHQGYKRIYDHTYSIKDIHPLGQNSNEPGIGKLLKQLPSSIHRLQHRFNLYLQLQELLSIRKKYKEMETSLCSVLAEQGMFIKDVQGDGNCMFRAISDQLYGNEIYHKELRKYAMQYILQEKDYFQDYIINSNVEEYVEYKSKDGVWGDNIELQAFRELYDIPIEIYVCSKEPLKTGLEANPYNKEPIRLSYHGRSHYNSIKLKDKQHQALLGAMEVSQYENQMFEKLLQQRNKQSQGLFRPGQQLSRAQFDNCISNELDIIFNESKRLFQDQQLKKYTAIKESLQQLEYEEDEEQLMDMIIKESVQDVQFQQQQQQQQQKQQQQNLENEILKKIMEQSKYEQEQQFMQQFEDTQFQTALKESENTLYEDPMNNPIIAQVMAMGFFTLEQVVEAYAIHREDPDMIINYLYENFQ